MVRPLPLQSIAQKIYPCNQQGRIRHTKLMILHAAIVSKNGASKIIVNSPDGDTVLLIDFVVSPW